MQYRLDPFFQFSQRHFKSSEGDVPLPMFFLDADNVNTAFSASREGVADLLRGTGLKPALFWLGKPLVFISFYEYRDSSVGAYNEVGVVDMCDAE